MFVKRLPNGKTADISGIPNKLWKHGDAQILGGLLNILNACLVLGTVLAEWRQTSKIDPKGGRTSFFAASVFVDNTIWVGNCLAATQYILNIASEFFLINDISINTDKTVTIPINQGAREVLLSISGSEISIAKKDESY
ncbi:hypothetical protein G9A89_000095 [Geosiphon pyriformis]|nr:hypothetical protein G9A89_000095 [Geosiphon pyriformis]